MDAALEKSGAFFLEIIIANLQNSPELQGRIYH